MKLIVVWFLTPEGKIILKEKNLTTKNIFSALYNLAKNKETIRGALERIKKQLEPYVPEGKYKISFSEFFREKNGVKTESFREFILFVLCHSFPKYQLR